MKAAKYFSLVAYLMIFLSTSLVAQEKEMTSEEWEAEINRLTTRKAEFTSQVDQLNEDIAGVKAKIAALQSFEECKSELYAMVGATEADVSKFGKAVDALAKKINGRVAEKEDRQAELDDLKMSKISALPAFFSKVHSQLQRQLDAWKVKPKEILYSVVRGDCLWNIAKKKDIYDNGFAWPKIYNANRDQIKNPDLIYPDQVFKIPNLTEEEKSKYNKLRSNYKPAPANQ